MESWNFLSNEFLNNFEGVSDIQNLSKYSNTFNHVPAIKLNKLLYTYRPS